MNVLLETLWQRWRASRLLVIIICFVAFFLEYTLYMCVIPIIPNYLYETEHKTRQNIVNNCSLNFTGKLSSAVWNNANISCVFIRNETLRSTQLQEEAARVGTLMAATGVTQLLGNSMIGIITLRIGYTIPMFLGFSLMLTTIMIFIFATTYTWFVVARVIEGVGASLSFASASGMLSERFPDDHERGIILGRAQSGMSLGATVGPIYGGVLYYYFGKTVPFAILAGVVLIDGLLRLSIISKKPETDYENFRKKKNLGGCSTLMFLQDPLILITVGAIIVSLIGIRALQSILPIHMMIVSPTITSLQEGLIMVPLAIGFGTSQNTLGSLSFRVGRWLSCLIGLWIIGIGFLIMSWCDSIPVLLVVIYIIGFGGGTVLVSAAPILPRLIELRHSSSDFASVFALFDSAICLAAILGNSIGGYLMNVIGFSWICIMAAVLQFLYAPLLIFLRVEKEAKSEDEHQSLIKDESMTSMVSPDSSTIPR